MRVFFTVQGEGRGHLTQALALRDLLERQEHTIVGVTVGSNGQRPVPDYFLKGFKTPVLSLRSPGFAFRAARGVAWGDSACRWLRELPLHARSLLRLRRALRQTRPDVVVNFLEPLMGWHNLLWGARLPTLVVGHQYMLEHPAFPRVEAFRTAQRLMRGYLRVVGAGATRLALSFYPAADLPERRLKVCPPLLRPQLFALHPRAGDHLLVYLLNHGYAAAVERWHARHPHVPVHCFYDRPGAPAEEQRRPNLVFHRLDGEKFLRMMADARAVATTAGFETACEAAWLQKPLLLAPVAHHVEQFLNACDAEQAGLAARDTGFDLSRLMHPDAPAGTAAFRHWVAQAGRVALQAVESAAAFVPRPFTDSATLPDPLPPLAGEPA